MRHRLYVFICLSLVVLVSALAFPGLPVPTRGEGFGLSLEGPVGALVVNLDHRTDRMTHFQHNFSQTDLSHTIPLHRISAVDGKKLDATRILSITAITEMQEFLRTKVRRRHAQLTPGAIGCYMSHIKCWEYVSQQNRPWLICEDDVVLPPDLGKHISTALAMAPVEKLETVILFHVLCDPRLYHELKCEKVEGNLFRAEHFWSTACYYLTPEAARAMLAKALPMEIQVDHAMALWGRENAITNFAYPVVRTWDRGDTDIQAPLVQP